MLESLNNFDHSLFLKIHQFRNSFLDEAMPLITGKWLWIPLYAILLFLVWRRFGKQTMLIVGTIAVMILLTDQTSNILKNSVCRLRPCYDPLLSGQVITPLGGGGQYGFVSAHAANTFAIATFLFLLSGIQKGFPNVKKRRGWFLLFPWSLLICWSRIYVGVHFPFDLIAGCMIGAFWAVTMYLLYKKVIPVLK
jgi:undecaprenyl-diphosphatase